MEKGLKEVLPKMDLIDKMLWILLATTLEQNGMTTAQMINVAKGYRDSEIYEICKEYVREEMLEAAALMASHFAGEEMEKIELEVQRKAREKARSGCKFSDILG